jgi:outer membrane murein-binding lipoprotein Lpp
MNYTVPDQLKEILLRRRNKVLINCENNICDIYKDNVLKRINEFDHLKNCCSIENVMENSIDVKINGTILKFINGELDNNIKEIENFKSEYESLSKIIKEETDIINDKMKLALSFNENLGNLGYSMDEKMFRIVSTLNIKDIEELNNEIIPKLKNMIGNNVEYKPLYPNFPSQVINMKNIVLYLNAIVHYWSGGKYIPYTEVEEREKTNIEVQYKNISVGKIEDIHELMRNLMSAAEAISEQDIKDLNIYFENYSDFINTVPEIIGNKENLAITVNLIIKNSKEIPMDKLVSRFSTVTDVLRLAAVMSGQSASLRNVKFKSFSNKERRFLMELLNNCGNRLEDFYKNGNLWERLCEKIHPNIYKKKYPDLVDDLLGAYKFKRNVKSFKKEIDNYKIILSSYNYYKENPDLVIETSDNRKVLNKQSSKMDIKVKEFIDAFYILAKIRPKIPEQIYSNINDIKSKLIEHPESNKPILNIETLKIEERIEQLNAKIVEMENKIKAYKQAHKRYATKVAETLNGKEFDETLKLLSQRPGIFSRRLDELLTKVNDDDKVLKYFEELAPKISVKVLLSLKGYFQKRFEKLKVRVFLIKGKTSKLYLKKNVKEALSLDLCEKICTICDQALINHFKDKPKLNNVYISEKLKKYLIPLDVRSASSALETYSKGSRFDLSFKKLTEEEQKEYIKDLEIELENYEGKLKDINEKLIQLQTNINKEGITDDEKNNIANDIKTLEGNNNELNDKINNIKSKIMNVKSELGKGKCNKVRLFIWWTNTKNGTRIDIDLSAVIFNKDFEQMEHVSFTNLKSDNYEVYHSGDIVDGGDVNGKGAAEFIDFDPEQIVAGGGRYISASVISYSGIEFNKLDNCKFGWMERESLSSNELFEPKTVRQKLDINVDKTSTTPVVFDCLTREVVWLDATLIQKGSCICIENSKKSMNAILYYYLCPLKDDIYDLINLHVQARGGNLVKSENELSEGDIAFVPYLPYKCKEGVKYIRPTDLDIILSEYMTSALK